jgi:hypothetical protein
LVVCGCKDNLIFRNARMFVGYFCVRVEFLFVGMGGEERTPAPRFGRLSHPDVRGVTHSTPDYPAERLVCPPDSRYPDAEHSPTRSDLVRGPRKARRRQLGSEVTTQQSIKIQRTPAGSTRRRALM